MNERILIDPDTYFWLRSGQPLKSIQEFALHLPLISDEDFSHHVRQEQNDFANWIHELFAEHELAFALKRCRNKAQMQTVLYNHIMRSWLSEQGHMPSREHGMTHDVTELQQRHWRY